MTCPYFKANFYAITKHSESYIPNAKPFISIHFKQNCLLSTSGWRILTSLFVVNGVLSKKLSGSPSSIGQPDTFFRSCGSPDSIVSEPNGRSESVSNQGEDFLAFELNERVAHITLGDVLHALNLTFFAVRLQILIQVHVLDTLLGNLVVEVFLKN